MNRELQRMFKSGEDNVSELLKGLVQVNKNLGDLSTRLDRLIMLLGVVGAANLFLGNGIADRIPNKGSEKSEVTSCQKGSQRAALSADWSCSYYERMD